MPESDEKMVEYEFDDETSSTDPKGSWDDGCGYYSRTYKCLVPADIVDDENLVMAYIWAHEGETGFWLD